MAQPYELNYGWAKLGPIVWTPRSSVTLQFDLHSDDDGAGAAVWEALTPWWETLELGGPLPGFAGPPANIPRGPVVRLVGGCRIPSPTRVSEYHTTGWIISSGEDAFDSIAHYAEHVRGVVEHADPDVDITWTELPHR